jgi:ABC-type transport system involved in multi-copper enzyme maturation permease subunit
MSALLRAELLKLRTTRTFAALLGVSMLLSVLITYLSATHGSLGHDSVKNNMLAADSSGALILLLGVIGMAGEWRHRTITSAVLASPARARMLTAKLLSHAVAGIVLSLVSMTTIILVGNLVLSSHGHDTLAASAAPDMLWRSALVAALLGALGVCIGALVRHQTIAVVGVMIVAIVVDPILMQGAPEIARFEPLLGVPSGILNGNDALGGHELTLVAAVTLGIAWVAASFAAAAALLRRRDLV